MKKFSLFILMFIFIFLFPIKNVQANSTKYVKVGLTKNKNVKGIHIDNESILVGYSNNLEFVNKGRLVSSSGFDIKLLGNYYVKLPNTFSTYDEALNFLNLNSKENMFIMLENDNWKIYINNFNSVLEAQNYISKNNFLGEVSNISNVIGIYSNNKLLMGYTGNNLFQIKEDNKRLSINNKLYRNILQINVNSGLLSVINVIDIEEYLYGVVPSEMPASWHKEALKAQSVAARNYIYSNLNLHSAEGFDVCDTTHCQVYNGIAGENDATNKAVDETKGVLAYYNGQIINAVYSSSNGGYSENSENVWNEKLDYLRAVKDENEVGGKIWERSFTFDELSTLIGNIGNVNEIILESSNVTGRALRLTLIGDSGRKVLEKEDIRTFFSKSYGGSLESRNFILKGSSIRSNNNSNISNSNNNILYVVNDKNTYELDIKNSYIISSNLEIIKDKPKIAIDKTGNIISIDNTFIDSNINSSTNNNTNTEKINVSSVKRVNSSSVTFSGKGWGHGVGMSQFGANSLAQKGFTYEEILKYYYTGIEVK